MIDATKLHKALVHPGKIPRHEFLEPLGITPYRLAGPIGVPGARIIVRGKRGITADTALRLAAHFDTTPDFWNGPANSAARSAPGGSSPRC